MTEIIYINLGQFQSHIIHSIKNTSLFNNNITIITEPNLINNFKSIENINIINTNNIPITEFYKNNKNDIEYLNGFWTHTSARLFYLYMYIKKYNKKNCFHIENDVMVYENLSNIIPDKNKNNKIYLTMDCKDRCIPGIIYIPNNNLMEPLINNYIYDKNDMINMAVFYNTNNKICEPFPIIKNNKFYTIDDTFFKNFDDFNTIFDAAAIGQYLGGIDKIHSENNTEGFINETCVVDYSKYNFYWKKKNKLYIPYIEINNKLIQIINLHIHSKLNKNFMSDNPLETTTIKYHNPLETTTIKYHNPLETTTIKYHNPLETTTTKYNKILRSENIFSGEKIQIYCNHFIGKVNDIKYNLKIYNNYIDKFIDIDNINNNINNNFKIFCYSNCLNNITFLISKLKFLVNPFILIFHNSDINFNNKDLILFDNLPNLKKIYTQNMNTIDNKVIPLPIGISNSMWPHGNISKLIEIMSQNTIKDKLIFFNFNINTSYEKRNECYQKIKSKNIEFLQNISFSDYLKKLSEYKYCICPEGNGIDTHRFWECIYLNVIPICKKNILVNYLKQYINIIILEDWDDLDINILSNNYNNKININNSSIENLNYYYNLINNDEIEYIK
jgi:hypothetical protein